MQRMNDNSVIWCFRTPLDPQLCAEVARRLANAKSGRRPPLAVAVVAARQVTLEPKLGWSLVVHLPRWDVREIRHCVSFGACSFVTDSCGAEEFAQAIYGAAFGRSTLPPQILAEVALLDGFGPTMLDDGDRMILEMASIGASHCEIAVALNWSERTIRRRLTAIRRRLGAVSTIEAVAIAASRGELRSREMFDAAPTESGAVAIPLSKADRDVTTRSVPDMNGVCGDDSPSNRPSSIRTATSSPC